LLEHSTQGWRSINQHMYFGFVMKMKNYFPRTVGIHHFANPRKVFRASAKRAVRTGPFIFAIQTDKALAVVVHLTSSVMRAVVLAKASHSSSTLSIRNNFTPSLSFVGRSTCRSHKWLQTWLI